MLPVKLKPRGFDQRDKETWESYCSRLSLTQDEAQREFYRQVVYDHFDHFNDLYPGFELDQYRPLISEMTASVAQARIRYFDNVRMTKWSWQYDEFERKDWDYHVFQHMREKGTVPFPPILIDASDLSHDRYIYGQPLHLIEGTHRVSYLNRMLERELISPDSSHKFVILTSKTCISG